MVVLNTPGHGDTLRGEIQLLKTMGGFSARTQYWHDQAAAAIDTFQAAVNADHLAGTFTQRGLALQFLRHREPLLLLIGRLGKAAQLAEDNLGAKIDNVLATLSTPPRDAMEVWQIEQMQRLLAGISDLERSAILKTTAARANLANPADEGFRLLRAALTHPRLPEGWTSVQGWTVLVTEADRSAVRDVIEDRVSPQGGGAHDAMQLRSLATRLKRIAQIDDFLAKTTGKDPVADALQQALADEHRAHEASEAEIRRIEETLAAR